MHPQCGVLFYHGHVLMKKVSVNGSKLRSEFKIGSIATQKVTAGILVYIFARASLILMLRQMLQGTVKIQILIQLVWDGAWDCF